LLLSDVAPDVPPAPAVSLCVAVDAPPAPPLDVAVFPLFVPAPPAPPVSAMVIADKAADVWDTVDVWVDVLLPELVALAVLLGSFADESVGVFVALPSVFVFVCVAVDESPGELLSSAAAAPTPMASAAIASTSGRSSLRVVNAVLSSLGSFLDEPSCGVGVTPFPGC